MKKLFGGKPKNNKGTSSATYSISSEEYATSTPIHQQHASYPSQQPNSTHVYATHPRLPQRRPSDNDQWDLLPDAQLRNQVHPPSSPSHNSSFISLPPGASPPIPSPNGARSPSPISINSNKGSQPRDREPLQVQSQQMLRKKTPTTAPVAIGILRSLDPPNSQLPVRTHSEERFLSTYSDTGHGRERDVLERKEKRGFWSRGDKDKEKEREREREREARERTRFNDSREHAKDRERREGEGAELTRMIGYLTATASEDWGLVMEVCERASSSENNAKDAVRALRREFKYGEPPAQLSAARLWAIMLRNSTELFVSQSTTRKFLDTLEDLLNSSRTSPVVRERVLDVIAAAAYASGGKKDAGFRGLWRRVKPYDKPDEGMPLDNDDAMFNPPISSRGSYYEFDHSEPLPVVTPTTHPPTSRRHKPSEGRNRIIPPEEDVRRLFQECKIGLGNASLLSQALALSRPEDLKRKEVIGEFYTKCRTSQELIFAQIPWASAEAEKSRAQKDNEALMNGWPEEQRLEETKHEKLLESLLNANAELQAALSQYDDLERVALERKAEETSKKEAKMDRRQLQQYHQDGEPLSDMPSVTGVAGRSSPSSSRPPSPSHTPVHQPHPHAALEFSGLAPPRTAPHGPRLPAQFSTHAHTQSRTPSPPTPSISEAAPTSGPDGLENGVAHLRLRDETSPSVSEDDRLNTWDGQTPTAPSAKALGKRKVVEEDAQENFGEEDFYETKDGPYSIDERSDSDDDQSTQEGLRLLHRPVQYVYDAAAERTQQRIREGHALVNGVH